MTPSRYSARLAALVLAVFLTAAGAPVALCATMPDCPTMAPAEQCHGSSGIERHCPPPRVDASDDCCGMMAAQPLPVAAAETTAADRGLDAALPTAVSAPAVPAPGPTASPPGVRPLQRSGRTLLSLHQTLLI